MHNSQGVSQNWNNTYNASLSTFPCTLVCLSNEHSLNYGLRVGLHLKVVPREIPILAVNTLCWKTLERAADNC